VVATATAAATTATAATTTAATATTTTAVSDGLRIRSDGHGGILVGIAELVEELPRPYGV